MRESEHEQLLSDVAELREIVAARSTQTIAGTAFTYWLTRNSPAEHLLLSAARQWNFLLGLMLGTPEPTSARQFEESDLKRSCDLLNSIYAAYAWAYWPAPGEDITEEWRRPREVAMPAFLVYVNEGFLASTDQMERRAERYLAPFDYVLLNDLGLTATRAIEICRAIRDELQEAVDSLTKTAASEHHARVALLDRAGREGWSLERLRAEARTPGYRPLASALWSEVNQFGFVSLAALTAQFGADATAFWNLFVAARGTGPPLTYPTEANVADERSLYVIDADRAICPLSNQLFLAVLLRFERHLASGAERERFFRSRDVALEREVEQSFRALLGPKAEILPGVYETADQQFEHDLVVWLGRVVVVVEAKARPPVEPFRDPNRAFVRIKQAFKSDRGIQSAYEQGRRLWRQWSEGRRVQLYNERSEPVLSFDRADVDEMFLVCATRDSFGILATDLSLLLEKEPTDPWPWCVNAIDLDAVADAWDYFGWTGDRVLAFLRDRVKLQGLVKCADELEAVGFFIRHGGYHRLLEQQTDFIWLDAAEASIFDDIWKARRGYGPGVKYEPTEPVFTDARKTLEAALQPSTATAAVEPMRRRKQGRNEPCACGSGKKYKRCHGR